MLTITPKETQPTDDLRYAIEIFTVMVSDGGESNAIPIIVPARRNRAPMGSVTDTNINDATATVGTQVPDKAPDAVRACTADDGAGANQCYVDVTFTDDDSSTENPEKLSFTATSSDTSKVEVVSVDTAPADPANPLVARLVVKGIASTWDSTLDNPAHDPVELVVVATDAGGETARGKAQITVDGQPTAETLPDGSVSQATPTYTFGPIAGFFKNPEGGEATFVAADQKSSNENVATVEIGGGGTVTVTRVAKGTAEITITALEPRADDGPPQTVSATFTVTATD
jgi:hypothetical protein